MSARSKLPGPPGQLGPPGPVTDLETYMRKLSAIVRETPALAPLAYTRAAGHVRSQIMRPENRGKGLELQAIACKLDQMAAESTEGMFQADETDAIGEASSENVVGEDIEDLFASSPPSEKEYVVPVQITPASASPEATLFGQQVLIQYGASGNSTGSYASSGGALSGAVVPVSESQVCRWEGRITESMPVTVAVNPLTSLSGATYPPPATGLLFSYRNFFRVRWGSGRGQLCQAIGDIGNGVQFTVACSSLYVDVGQDVPYPGVPAGSIWLNASMSFFSSSRVSQVFRTMYVDQLAAAATTKVTIPAFATTLEAINTATLGNFSIRIDSTPGSSGTGRNLATVSNSATQVRSNAIALPSEAYQVTITNNAGTPQDLNLVFGLSL